MLNRLSIRERLLLSFAAVLCPLLAVAALSLQVFRTLGDKTDALIDEEVGRVILAQQANEHAQAAAITLLKILQTPGRQQRVPLYQRMDSENDAARTAFVALGEIAGAAEQRAAVDRIVRLGMAYAETFQETIELLELRGPAAAQRHFEAQTGVALEALLRETRQLIVDHQKKAEAEVTQLRADSERAVMLAILLTVAALLAAGALGWRIARSIVKPIREAVSVAETIADGDYEQKVPSGKGPEIGALLRALTVMRDSIGSRERRIMRLAYDDVLTGLPNRTRFLELFADRIATGPGVLMILDVDRFASINKALGHAVGDRLLQELAIRLKQNVGATDIVARLWGDEFALLLGAMDRAAVESFATRVLSGLRAPISVDGQRLDVDASLGIVHFPADGATTIALLRRADLAMAAAKRRHDGFAFGAEFGDTPRHEQLSLIGEMREGLSRREFVAYYQPKLDLARKRVTGAEALIRWRHPAKGMVPPGNFIPFAEQTGFIREITPWILRQAIEHAAEWRRAGVDIVTSVNLSTHDLLNPHLVEVVRDLIAACALPPDRLCLEITESALMDEPETALRHLNELAGLGLKLAIDDYGTGQASLAYVKTLPVHELKIDREFVANVDADRKNAAIVGSTILLCRDLGLLVVAEGAETAGEIAWLERKSCDLVQGFGVARPMPAAEFFAWVADYNQRPVADNP